MNAHPTPATERDASNRALRTFAQGLVFDVLAAVAVALTVAVSAEIEWTSTYWQGLALAVLKSVLVAFVSYFARVLVPPASPTMEGGVAP